MSETYILAHDLGTTGDKATLYDSQGNLQQAFFYPYNTVYPQENWAEQDPNDWWKAVCISSNKILENSKVLPKDIKATTFSGQMMGTLPVDNHGTPLRHAIIWADQRAAEQTDELRDKIGMRQIYKITGHRASSSYSAAKIMWIRANQPDIFKKSFKFLQAKDYIVMKFTGNFATDYSDASGTNLFNLTKREWSTEILSKIRLSPTILPDVHSSTDVIGELTEEAAKKTGLVAGIPVVIGGGDGSCAATGAGVVREGIAYSYLGSSSWIALATRELIDDPKMRTFNWAHLDSELFSPCGTMQSAGGSLEWAKNNLCSSETTVAERLGLSPYELINLEISRSARGSQKLLFLPYLLGERSPYWNPKARGTFIGLTPSHTKNDMLRAIMEGVGFNLRIIMEAFEDQGATINDVRLIGGGANGQAWRRIMTSIFGKPLLIMSHPLEATSLGAAIAAGVGVGIFPDFSVAEKLVSVVQRVEPDSQIAPFYTALFEIFKESYEQLVPIFDQLSTLPTSGEEA